MPACRPLSIVLLLLAQLPVPSLAASDGLVGDADFMPSSDCPVGWRGDGSGVFPGAGPIPRAWDPQRGNGVAWKTPMPGYSNATPLVVGDLVITQADPDMLIACDRDSGEIAWGVTLADLPDKARAIAAEVSLLQGSYEQTVGDGKVQGKGVKLFKSLFSKGKKGWDDPYNLCMTKSWQQHTSRTMATPICDGERIYVKLQIGVVACVDLGGSVKWHRQFPVWGKTDVISPMLADGVLIIMHGDENITWGLDADSGRELWSSKQIKRCSWGAGSFVAYRSDDATAVISSGGTVFDPRSGGIRFPAVGTHADGGSPGIWQGILAFGPSDGRGYRTRFNNAHKNMSKDERKQAMQQDRVKKAKEMDLHEIGGNRIIRLAFVDGELKGEVYHHSLDGSYDCTFNSLLVHPNGCAYFCNGKVNGGTITVLDLKSKRVIQECELPEVAGTKEKCFNQGGPPPTTQGLSIGLRPTFLLFHQGTSSPEPPVPRRLVTAPLSKRCFLSLSQAIEALLFARRHPQDLQLQHARSPRAWGEEPGHHLRHRLRRPPEPGPQPADGTPCRLAGDARWQHLLPHRLPLVAHRWIRQLNKSAILSARSARTHPRSCRQVLAAQGRSRSLRRC